LQFRARGEQIDNDYFPDHGFFPGMDDLLGDMGDNTSNADRCA
jgi:hypothetical protein